MRSPQINMVMGLHYASSGGRLPRYDHFRPITTKPLYQNGYKIATSMIGKVNSCTFVLVVFVTSLTPQSYLKCRSARFAFAMEAHGKCTAYGAPYSNDCHTPTASDQQVSRPMQARNVAKTPAS